MGDLPGHRSYGKVFDAIVDEYNRHRPAYPEALVDRACEIGELARGAPVLEIGCGTGQLTRSLLGRGLHVTAIEPGTRLTARARIELEGAGPVEFMTARLEDARVPCSWYRAVFSASAIHWADPEVSWRKSASALVNGGILALFSYFGLRDSYSEQDQQALRDVLTTIAPEIAAGWPTARDLEAILAGAHQRRENVSQVWAWLGDYDIARDEAAHLFEDAELAALPIQSEHTAAEVNSLLGTMSFWARLSPRQRDALVAENDAVAKRLGRPIRATRVACLVTARRRPEH
jgi:SAM-dependent methyltransferase